MNKETLTRRFAEARDALSALADELHCHGEAVDCRDVERMRDALRRMEREIRAAAEAGDA